MKISSAQWEELLFFLGSLGVSFESASLDLLLEDLSRYLSLLLKKNEEVNLTAIRDFESAVWKHLADSLALLQWEPLGSVLDWGSGGGLPGIPLALARRASGSSSPVWFLDSVGKKIRAVEEFSGQLGLNSCRFFNGRGEDLAGSGALESIETVVMRAVAPADRSVQWLHPSFRRWVFLLGPQQRESWQVVKAKVERKGFSFGREATYSLPHNQGSRILLELYRI